MRDLSVLIPSRNEEFLARTVEGVLAVKEADTEVIIVLDGAWADPPIKSHPDVTIIYHSKSIGQRAACNEAARLSQAKYIMKLDAHCIMDQGFDRKLIEDAQPDWTVIPRQYNLYVFDRICRDCGHEAYQGPTECENCGSKNIERKMVWQPRDGRVVDRNTGEIIPRPTRAANERNCGKRLTESWCFDRDLHFQYHGEITDRQSGDIIETMSLLGACWFLERERYWALGGSDEDHGSWGQQGTEIACKSWLSGGKVMVNRKTWFAHAFRTQGKDWGFPYPNNSIHKAREYSKWLWRGNNWPLAKYPLSWLVERFMPLGPWWSQEDLDALKAEEANKPVPVKPKAGVVYYTHNQLDPVIAETCRDVLRRSVNGHSIVSVSLQPIQFGRNIVINEEKGYLTYLKQILAGLEASEADYVFMAEHDCLYPPEAFAFAPPRQDRYYYNTNVVKLRHDDGHVVSYDDCLQVSGLCAYRKLLIQHYRKRIARFAQDGYKYDRRIGYEPGMRPPPKGIDEYGYETWSSARPVVDIRVPGTMSKSRWSTSEFRNKNTCRNWQEHTGIEGWGETKGRFWEFLSELRS